jgi:bifunctional non-homologous end joining protein LigD
MNTGTKTEAPVPYAKAKKVFDKLVNDKLAKGYVLKGNQTVVFADGSSNKVQTNIRPQLLNAIGESALGPLFTNSEFFMQEKMDGERRLIQRTGDKVIGINKKGQEVPLPVSIVSAVYSLTEDQVLLDGEQMGEVYHAFDLLEASGSNLRSDPYIERLNNLFAVAANTFGESEHPNFRTVLTFTKEPSKRKGFQRIQDAKGEGVVFKDRTAPFSPGKPNSGGPQLKFKFTASATCQVLARNGAKRSVQLAVGTTSGALTEIGNVTIPANFAVPGVGALIEVQYLYAYPNGGSLYQPVYLGVRDDTDLNLYGSLKFKQGTTVEEDDEAA